MDLGLKGKITMVGGASKGLGFAIARALAGEVRQLDEINANRQGISLTDHQARAAASIPLGRYGAPDDFGRVGAFLLSDAASYITGASVQVDGGLIKGLL